MKAPENDFVAGRAPFVPGQETSMTPQRTKMLRTKMFRTKVFRLSRSALVPAVAWLASIGCVRHVPLDAQLACPCAPGWTCDTAQNLCRPKADAAAADGLGAGDSGAGAGASGQSGAGGGTSGAGGNVDGAAVDVDATPGALPDFADGTRLKARSYVAEGGATLFREWWDTERKEVCSFALAEDGKVRCLPPHIEASYFSDDKCEAPMQPLPPCFGTAPYLTVSPNACKVGSFHKVTGTVTPTAEFVRGGSQCAKLPPPPGVPLPMYWQAGAAELPTAFVEAEEIHDDRGSGLMARYYRGADGSLQLVGPYDHAAARACAPLPKFPDVCLPVGIPEIQLSPAYADAACTQPTVMPPPASCDNSPYEGELAVRSHECSGGTVYQLGADFAERPFIKGAGATCAQGTGQSFPASKFRRLLGAEVPLSTFPTVSTTYEGEGRVKLQVLDTQLGRHLAATAFFDAANGQTCTPVDVGGTTRCLPDIDADLAGTFYYGDDACTWLVWVAGFPCGVPKQVIRRDKTTCDTRQATGTAHLYDVVPITTLPAAAYGGDPCRKLIDPFYFTAAETFVLKERPVTDAPTVSAAGP
jgi:hypothetical protein